MILSYIRSAHRNVIRNKVQSFIQIFSLAIGFTVFTLVTVYLYDELTIDRSNPFLEQVFRVEEKSEMSHGKDIVSIAMGPVILDSVPEISQMTRVNFQGGASIVYEGDHGELRQLEMNSCMNVDPDFQQIFPQEYIFGDPDGLFKIPRGVVLTESVSRFLFGDTNPVGKKVLVWGAASKTVTGVIRDPKNTHLRFEAMFPQRDWYKLLERKGRHLDVSGIYSHGCVAYVRVAQGTDIQKLEIRIADAWNNFLDGSFGCGVGITESIFLRPLKDVPYADIDPYKGYMRKVDRKNLRSLLLMGLGILLLGMINYVNLSTARASMRQREMAIRKINGASRLSLIKYLLTESVITSFLSFLVAVTLSQLLYLKFSYLLVADINLYFLRSPLSWILAVLTILLIGVLVGLYPALRISSEPALAMFSGASRKKGIGLYTRRILMIMQFSSAVVLLIVIFTMNRQIKFMLNQDPGFNTEQVLFMGTGASTNQDRFDLRSRLMAISEVEMVSFTHDLPSINLTQDLKVVDDPESLFHGLELKLVPSVDKEFFEVYELKFTHGGEILDHSSLDSVFNDSSDMNDVEYFVINESCRKALNLETPIGLPFNFMGIKSIIVGVVEDYHYQSLRYQVKPNALRLSEEGSGWMCSIKIKGNNIPETIEDIDKAVYATNTHLNSIEKRKARLPYYRTKFIDVAIARQYEEEERIQTASTYLSIMAVIIACLGLFGLSTFMAHRRVKEMGIRRALGASEGVVFKLLVKDFLLWVSISVIIGIPAGYLLANQWQQQFAYKASFGAGVYLLTVALVFMVALTTVAWQSYRASRANPVDSIRKE